jgi:hypothetical protein
MSHARRLALWLLLVAAPAAATPLRIVIKSGGAKLANCVFSTVVLPEVGPPPGPIRTQFGAGEPIWGRCFLPERAGANRPHELVDVVSVDGKQLWEQAYDRAVPPGALGRTVPYGELLRGVLAALAPGSHRVVIEGWWRRGKKPTRAYRGEFRYSR